MLPLLQLCCPRIFLCVNGTQYFLWSHLHVSLNLGWDLENPIIDYVVVKPGDRQAFLQDQLHLGLTVGGNHDAEYVTSGRLRLILKDGRVGQRGLVTRVRDQHLADRLISTRRNRSLWKLFTVSGPSHKLQATP